MKNKYCCTVNDVVVSICAGAVRSWLLEHDDLPADPLVVQVPVSVRTDEQIGTYGNRIMLMSAPLFTNEPDPVRRLRKTHDALAAMKERHRALPAELLQDTNHFILYTAAWRRRPSRSPPAAWWPDLEPGRLQRSPRQFPLYCAGARWSRTTPSR